MNIFYIEIFRKVCCLTSKVGNTSRDERRHMNDRQLFPDRYAVILVHVNALHVHVNALHVNENAN